MRNQDPARLTHALRDQLFIERDDRAKIDDFDRLALGLELQCDFHRQMDSVAPGDDREVLTFAHDAALAERDYVIGVRLISLGLQAAVRKVQRSGLKSAVSSMGRWRIGKQCIPKRGAHTIET